ncbi:hypothetical protein [Salinisphaera sp. G21_0]|uniref:hypothetical protein n=1 Tax=Salinisphaera sp. G21_0 TaxID=2821094 RepID=UPI001ADC85E9|nr:hypothetical protein [Salinisphaera sp. G21_0]MBO9484724.1 hypothetical protein [Salinisphaera sp. G21_0]
MASGRRLNDPDLEEVSISVEQACLMVHGIDGIGSFADFSRWYGERLAEAEQFKKNNAETLYEEVNNFLTSGMWLARHSEADKTHSDLQAKIEKGELPDCYISQVYNSRSRQEEDVYFISYKDLRTYCYGRGIFPEFLLPFEDENHKLLSEIRQLTERVAALEAELNEERSYADPNDPLFNKEVAATLAAYKHFRSHRERKKDSAKSRVRRWVRENFRHVGLHQNNTALIRISEVVNWEGKNVR